MGAPRLCQHLGDPAIACRFINRYTALLDERIDRLDRALVAQDPDAWMDCLLSLKTSSVMAGATAMAALAGELLDELGRRTNACFCEPCQARVADIMASLRRLAAQTVQQLSLFVDRTAAALC